MTQVFAVTATERQRFSERLTRLLAEAVLFLVLPALLVGAVAASVVQGLGAGTVAQEAVALLVGVPVGGWAAYCRHLSPAARLGRALVDAGLVHRRQDGRLIPPRRRGRVIREGRNRRMTWRLPPGIALEAVEKQLPAIEQRLDIELAAWSDGGRLHTEMLRHRLPAFVDFEAFYAGARPPGRLVVGIGVGRRGPLWADLATLPHLLVGGQTGGGKSVALRQIVTGLALAYNPDEVQLAFVDLKGGVELHRFGRLPHALLPVADEVRSAAEVLTQVRDLVTWRIAALRAADVEDIDALTVAGRPAWPRLVVVVDEVAELTLGYHGSDAAGREAQKSATGRLMEIARLGRAAGVHLIVCTQRPDVEAVPGQLKANLPATIAFRVRNASNSEILLGEGNHAAASLPPEPKGRGLWAHDREERFQGIHLTSSDSRRLLEERRCPAEPTRVGDVLSQPVGAGAEVS